MCSGKTTFGYALARRLGYSFIDLDDYIEKETGKSIREIFMEKGEEGFREIESEKLRKVGNMEKSVIACGGGTPCFYDNMEFINSIGKSVFLKTSKSTLLRRLLEGSEERPLVKDRTETEIKEIIENKLKEREKYYMRAHIIGNGDYLDTSEEIRKTVNEFVEKYFRN